MLFRGLVAVLSAVVAVVAAVPAGRLAKDKVEITKYNNQPNSGSGEYRYEFELSDGSRRYEEGQLQNAGTDREYLMVRGSFQRPRYDGTMEEVMYFADDEGFHIARMAPELGQAPPAALIASLVG